MIGFTRSVYFTLHIVTGEFGPVQRVLASRRRVQWPSQKPIPGKDPAPLDCPWPWSEAAGALDARRWLPQLQKNLEREGDVS